MILQGYDYHMIAATPPKVLPLWAASIWHRWLVYESLHVRWPKYWNFSFSISHSNEYLLYTWKKNPFESVFQWLFHQVCQQLERHPGPLKQCTTGVQKIWSLNLLHQHHLGTHEKYKFFSPFPDLLNQKFWWWSPGNCFNKPSQWFWRKLKFESHCSTYTLGISPQWGN